MRRTFLLVAAALSLGITATASAATKPPVVMRPQLLVVQALNQADGQNYPDSAGKAVFVFQLDRNHGKLSIGYKSYAVPHNLNGFTPVRNWSPAKPEPLKVKLRVGDTFQVCWLSGKLIVPGGLSKSCQSHTFSQLDVRKPYVYGFTLINPIVPTAAPL